MAIETVLILLGLILLCISYSLIKYLKTTKNGFTYEDLHENTLEDNLKIESLIITAIPTTTPNLTENHFGGGSFGGGGASGNF